MNSLPLKIAAVTLLVALTGCGKHSDVTPNGPNNIAPPGGGSSSPVASKPDPHNPSAPILPDPSKTPGDVLEVASSDVCVSGYSKLVRNVPSAVKRQVYESYGITHREKGEFEVDHLISLELGGSNSVKNLWPQSFLTEPWNAKVKDQLENELHAEICSGKIDMKTAQHEIATDWIASYKKHFNTDQPLNEKSAAKRYNSYGNSSRSKGHSSSTPNTAVEQSNSAEVDDAGSQTSPGSQSSSATNGTDKVWVNTRSGVIWKPGSEFYGKTKQGEYMTESEALAKGYHDAGGH